jgi:hypothetical protein
MKSLRSLSRESTFVLLYMICPVGLVNEVSAQVEEEAAVERMMKVQEVKCSTFSTTPSILR